MKRAFLLLAAASVASVAAWMAPSSFGQADEGKAGAAKQVSS